MTGFRRDQACYTALNGSTLAQLHRELGQWLRRGFGMTPRKQLFRHDPDAGVYGDCDRAAVASLLDMAVEGVPHFYDGIWAGSPDAEIEEAHGRRRRWLAGRGVRLIVLALNSPDLDQLLGSVSTTNPGAYYLLVGESRNRTGHTVVCHDGGIVHDPSLDDSGIIGPEPRSGCYWVEFLVPVGLVGVLSE